MEHSSCLSPHPHSMLSRQYCTAYRKLKSSVLTFFLIWFFLFASFRFLNFHHFLFDFLRIQNVMDFVIVSFATFCRPRSILFYCTLIAISLLVLRYARFRLCFIWIEIELRFVIIPWFFMQIESQFEKIMQTTIRCSFVLRHDSSSYQN